VDELIKEMEHIFYKKGSQNIIIVGRGNIGSSLANYHNFGQRKINIVATFDIDPSKQHIRSDTPVYTMERLSEIIERFCVRTAIIAVPHIAAQQVCDHLVTCGINGIINFAPVILKVPDHVIMNNINLSDEIESVIYCVSLNGKDCPECPE
jgi:redox-sensing transcriptional repressor